MNYRSTPHYKFNWWDKKAEKLQFAADRKDMKTFFTGLREIYGPKPRGLIQLKAMDGETVLQEKDKILDRFADHFDQLLDNPGDLSEEAKEVLVQRPVVSSLDEPPNVDELMSAIRTTQDGKAPERDGIPAEAQKCGVQLTNYLHKLIQEIWDAQKVPQDWMDASIVPLFRKDCGNYRGILLLATVGKILSRVILNRLSEHISQNVLLETQCGFRRGRSTMDMIFCLKQVQEKCIEQNMPLYVVFIDFSKAFDTVSRQGLWQILKKYGCTEKFVSLIEALHTGMQSNVTMSGSVCKDFSVSKGVKQGCVLAPTLFSLYLAAMLEVAFKDTSEGVYIQIRNKADLFNVTQFKAKSKKTSIKIVRENKCSLPTTVL